MALENLKVQDLQDSWFRNDFPPRNLPRPDSNSTERSERIASSVVETFSVLRELGLQYFSDSMLRNGVAGLFLFQLNSNSLQRSRYTAHDGVQSFVVLRAVLPALELVKSANNFCRNSARKSGSLSSPSFPLFSRETLASILTTRLPSASGQRKLVSSRRRDKGKRFRESVE